MRQLKPFVNGNEAKRLRTLELLSNPAFCRVFWWRENCTVFSVLLCVLNIMFCAFRFIHLMADPAFVTLGSVPFLLIRGLPRVAALQACFIQPPGINGYTTVNNDLSSPVAYYSSVVNNNTNVALGVKIGPGVQCLMALPYRLPTNITVLDASGIVPHRAQTIILHSLVSILPHICVKWMLNH